jgi:hypothetical protein
MARIAKRILFNLRGISNRWFDVPVKASKRCKHKTARKAG